MILPLFLLLLALGLFTLAMLSGMLGLGVAFAAVPFLSLFLSDLVNQVQPLTLLLNGLTALFAAFGFARSGYVDWSRVWMFAVATTAGAPVGSYLARFVPQNVIWIIYILCVVGLLYMLFRPARPTQGKSENLALALIIAVFVMVVASLLGVGPGFLLVPALIFLGFDTKNAAAINAVSATPASLVALLPRLPTAQFDPTLTIALLVAGAAGAFVGARVSSIYVSEKWLKLIFASVVILMSGYKFSTLLL